MYKAKLENNNSVEEVSIILPNEIDSINQQQISCNIRKIIKKKPIFIDKKLTVDDKSVYVKKVLPYDNKLTQYSNDKSYGTLESNRINTWYQENEQLIMELFLSINTSIRRMGFEWNISLRKLLNDFVRFLYYNSKLY